MSPEQDIALGAKRDAAASTRGIPITVEEICRITQELDPDGIIEGTPGQTGVIISNSHGNPLRVYRHPTWVLKLGTTEPGGTPTTEQSDRWNWELVSPQKSAQNANQVLKILKNGSFPLNFKIAIEFEGSAHNRNTGRLAPASHPHHPELNECTYENATSPAQTPAELAQYLGTAIRAFATEHPDLILEQSSVPQVGDLSDIHLNPHPYLQMAAPQVAALVKQIHPRAAIVLQPLLNSHPSVEELFRDYQLRLWPVAALHAHTGVPKSKLWAKTHEGCDGTLGMQMLNTLYTVSMQICSLMDANTTHLLRKKINGVRDVRHSLRRLLPTANGGHPYRTYEQELPNWKGEYISGAIHSPSRYPVVDQHGVGRPRTELQTIESTNTGMHPHLGIQLALASITRLHTIAALETIAKNPTDTVFNYAQQTYGTIMAPINPDMMVQIESNFDLYGWGGSVQLDRRTLLFRDLAYQIARQFIETGNKYPALKADSVLAAAYLIGASHSSGSPSIPDYFNPESPNFATGCLTDRKTDILEENIWGEVLTEAYWSERHAEIALQNPNLLLAPHNLIYLLKQVGLL